MTAPVRDPLLPTILAVSLSMSMAACGNAPVRSMATDLPAFQQQRLADDQARAQSQQVSEAVAQIPLQPTARNDNRLASTEPMVPVPVSVQPVAAQAPKALVLLRRTEPVVKPLTEEQLTEKLKSLNAASLAEARQITADTAASMQRVTAEELARLRHETAQQLILLDKQSQIYAMQAADQKAAEVENRSKELTELRDFKSERRFDDLTAATEQKVAQHLAAIREEEANKALEPEQVKRIAAATMEQSKPEMQALALKAVADSEDYIRTVARTAINDKDPAVQGALQEAARNVIVKDNQIVFAIRKVVDQRLDKRQAGAGQTDGQPRRGKDGKRTFYNGDDDVSLNGSDLQVGQPHNGNPFNPETAGSANVEPAAGEYKPLDGKQLASNERPSLMRARQRQDWVDLRSYRVVVHEDGKTMEQLVNDVVTKAEPFVGPWEIKWKIKPENNDVMTEKFSLDAETTFEEFVNYLANYMVNERGVKLSFSLFDSERVLVVSD